MRGRLLRLSYLRLKGLSATTALTHCLRIFYVEAVLWLRDLHPSELKKAATLAIAIGHTDQDWIYRHYRELVKPEEAEKYWNRCLLQQILAQKIVIVEIFVPKRRTVDALPQHTLQRMLDLVRIASIRQPLG